MSGRFHVETPCPADDAAMTAVPGGRFCARCEQTVLDLTDCTEAEAHARVGPGAACVEVRVDARGRPLFKVAAVAALLAGATGCFARKGGIRPAMVEEVRVPASCVPTTGDSTDRGAGSGPSREPTWPTSCTSCVSPPFARTTSAPRSPSCRTCGFVRARWRDAIRRPGT